jgi:hypothetical protein
VLEDIKTKKKFQSIQRKVKNVTLENLLSSPFDDSESFTKKRKRKDDNEYNINDEMNSSNKKSKFTEESTDKMTKSKEGYIEDDLFDKDGKLILVNFKL